MTLLVFGYGYSAAACAKLLQQHGENMVATVRSEHKCKALQTAGIKAFRFDGGHYDIELPDATRSATCILVSAPPDENGDPALRCFGQILRDSGNLKKIIYLSTIGVYGNFDGAWIDETTKPQSLAPRALRRLKAENDWLALGKDLGVNTHILRLAGIYGPGRNALCDFENGTARRIFKKDQVFNRIHVDDIALAAQAVLKSGLSSGIWNICDNEPCPPQDVVAYAAGLLGVEPPPLQPFETARLSEMGRAFYSENKRVSNLAMRERLGVDMLYPTYRQGLRALHAAGEGHNGNPSLRLKDKTRD